MPDEFEPGPVCQPIVSKSDDQLRALLDAASPGPWHHVNPGMVSSKTRTVHGSVPAERIDYVSRWPGVGTPTGHRMVTNREAGVCTADMALIAEAPALASEVIALRAGAAASDARIKALEEALAMADQLCRVALPQFNWAASALDGQAVFILNEAPGIIGRALLKEADQ